MRITAGLAPITATIPGADAGVVISTWGNMMFQIARHHHVRINKDVFFKTSTAIFKSVLSYSVTCQIFTAAISVVSGGLVLLAAVGLNALLNAFYTYKIGKLYDKLYSSKGMNVVASEISKLIFYNIGSDIQEFISLFNDCN